MQDIFIHMMYGIFYLRWKKSKKLWYLISEWPSYSFLNHTSVKNMLDKRILLLIYMHVWLWLKQSITHVLWMPCECWIWRLPFFCQFSVIPSKVTSLWWRQWPLITTGLDKSWALGVRHYTVSKYWAINITQHLPLSFYLSILAESKQGNELYDYI